MKIKTKAGHGGCPLPRARVNKEELRLGTPPPWEQGSVVSFCVSPRPPCPGESCLDRTERRWLRSEPLPASLSMSVLWPPGSCDCGAQRKDSCSIWKS